MIKTKRIYEPAEVGDGLRLLVMRFWPRGVKKEKADAWEPELGTSPALIKDWKGGKIDWEEFEKRYKAEMKGQRELVEKWAKEAKGKTITLLCSCEEAERCHRTVLKRILEEAARGSRG